MSERPPPWILWAPWLAAPGAWAAHETVSYILVSWVCATGRYWPLHLVTAVSLVVAAAAGAVAWHSLKLHGRADRPEREAVHSRGRFVAMVGLMLAAISFTGILLEATPNWLLDACARAY